MFDQCYRVLKNDGTVWVVIDDHWSKGPISYNRPPTTFTRNNHLPIAQIASDIPARNVVCIPFRLAFALQKRGWTWRSTIIWHKTIGSPEAVTSRPTHAHEYVLIFSKKLTGYDWNKDAKTPSMGLNGGRAYRREHGMNTGAPTKSYRDVWTIAPDKHTDHPAAFPMELARRALRLGCKPHGHVLDPFAGSGTTAAAAASLGLRCTSIELDPEYMQIAQERVSTILAPKQWRQPLVCADGSPLIHGTAIEELRKRPDNSVDFIILDPPYGTGATELAWDQPLDWDILWEETVASVVNGWVHCDLLQRAFEGATDYRSAEYLSSHLVLVAGAAFEYHAT